MISLLRLLQRRRLIQALASLRFARSLCERHVLVHQLVHVGAEDVLGVLVDVHFVASLPEDGRAAGRAAADANAREKLKSRDDGHREAPSADGLAAQPRAEEASEGGVHKRDDAADGGRSARRNGSWKWPGSERLAA